ncbi:MAG: succinylglutamate desuccinylase/aspartoacylase family protein [Betaproteobacteria bacterium]|nr:succinylglutamate desuccinylase/aspartoacylase family protein [Betaproteobacteria bacterium]
MIEQLHALLPPAPGTHAELLSLHFGSTIPGPKAYIQCALHADEIPGLLVGVHLRRELTLLESQGRLRGEVVLVPAANPLGGSQAVLGAQIGRFDLASGVNYNRGYLELTPALHQHLEGQLGPDAAGNTALIRRACTEALQAWSPATAPEALKRLLQLLAVDADTVLDLHCDSQALMHLYAPTPWAQTGLALGQWLGARVVLLAKESGDNPFDESVSRHWWELQEAYAGRHPIELGCFSTTVELRGEADVTHANARRDALGLLGFLEQRGHLEPGSIAPLAPTLKGLALPLEGVDPLVAPCGGVLVFGCELGQSVRAGQAVAEIIDPLTGGSTPVCSRVEGLFFAHSKTRWALRGQRIGKVAGAHAFRSGKLLSL